MRHLVISGKKVPVIGQGTYRMGQEKRERAAEMAALRKGVELGMTCIDTAEYYDDAESVIGEAFEGRRKEVYLVSKVMPSNATKKGTIAACEKSLKKLKTDYLDMYLLHWRGSVPLQETIAAFEELKQQGKIVDFGVSNFDVDDMEEAEGYSKGGAKVNQVLYNLNRRGIEWDLLPWCQKNKVVVMAYTPFDRGTIGENAAVKKVAERHGVTEGQVAVAWTLLQENVLVIPKAVQLQHVAENRAAADIKLTEQDIKELDAAFPPPRGKVGLETL